MENLTPEKEEKLKEISRKVYDLIGEETGHDIGDSMIVITSTYRAMENAFNKTLEYALKRMAESED